MTTNLPENSSRPASGAAIRYTAPVSHLTGKDDPLFKAAIDLVRKMRMASISMVQRHLCIGYNRAAYLVEAMEGTVVSKPDASGMRTVLPVSRISGVQQ